MHVLGVTDFASVVNRTRLDKRQRVITPESWLGWLLYRSNHVLQPFLWQVIEYRTIDETLSH